MVGGDENTGIAPGQGGLGGDRSWLQRVGAGGEGTQERAMWIQGWLTPKTKVPSKLIREQRLKAMEWGRWQGMDRVRGDDREPG